jgi:hypothetical protein
MDAGGIMTEKTRPARVPGWRGWLNDYEWLVRLYLGQREPYWHRVIRWWGWWWRCRRCELICRVVGHKPLRAHKLGSYCPRCGLGPEDEEWKA